MCSLFKMLLLSCFPLENEKMKKARTKRVESKRIIKI